jgi:hypothetical protein
MLLPTGDNIQNRGNRAGKYLSTLARCPYHLFAVQQKFNESMPGGQIDEKEIMKKVHQFKPQSFFAENQRHDGGEIRQILKHEKKAEKAPMSEQEDIAEIGTEEKKKAKITQYLVGPKLESVEFI